jgi:sulfur-oxidizing protein SoxY
MKSLYRMIRQLGLALCAAAAFPAYAADVDPSPDTEIWGKVRAGLFQDRAISSGNDAAVRLEVAARAEDGAVVPVAIKTQGQQRPDHYIRRIYLVVDHNPSPVAATFTLAPDTGRADIETRIRIEEYSYVRAIAETSDGKLSMAARYVKASGGCSAPAGKDQAAAMADLGKIRILLNDTVKLNQPTLVQLMVSHPNNSGMAMDQVTRHFAPAHYVKKLSVSYGKQPVFTADVNFSISENPNFRFYFVPRKEEQLQVEVQDTKDQVFRSAVQVRAGA